MPNFAPFTELTRIGNEFPILVM